MPDGMIMNAASMEFDWGSGSMITDSDGIRCFDATGNVMWSFGETAVYYDNTLHWTPDYYHSPRGWPRCAYCDRPHDPRDRRVMCAGCGATLERCDA
jgi:hypothetical protein